ncbi:MAG: serine hydroxymethyltransferase [Candidatus Bathyarchaeota archaeon]|nr:serine hydroxymethyltransferase [Candidatus Bathyarchaeota archaeon]MDH5702291.1 serine hydroxymethyltransferase [Candidatus Bathyarchaeota archaeon]
MEKDFSKMALELIESSKAHENYRSEECINLIASEGLKSPAVKEILSLSQDLESRYAEGENDLEGHVKERHYQGQKYITKIENCTADLMKNLFGCNWIDVRLVSGTHANLATFKGLSLATKSNRMVVAPLSAGAHITHDYSGLAGMVIGLETINHAYDLDEMNIDPDKSATIIKATRPGIVTFGGSLFQFPHPVKEIAEVAKESGAYVVYDAAHVLGLIAGGQFQDPLKEGADFITASTHKTFPGPQGGVILANSGDERMERAIRKVQNAVFPLTTSNTHLGRLPALGLVALELKLYGAELAKQTVKNAQTAGKYLFDNGLKILGEKKGFTRSHQIAVDVQDYGGGRKIAESLEEANIILNKNLLPHDDQHNRESPSGLRIGFQDVTRRGFKESDIKYLCDLMLDVVKGKRKPVEVRKDVITLRQNFKGIEYGFRSVNEAVDHLKKYA